MSEKWTAEDQRKLEELQDKKQRVHAARFVPLYNYVKDWMLGASLAEVQGTTDWMIRNADRLRDLLEPFDSGIRLANSEEQT